MQAYFFSFFYATLGILAALLSVAVFVAFALVIAQCFLSLRSWLRNFF